MKDSEVLAEKAKVETIINGKGRVLLRQSGTEPVIRVMIEAETQEKCKDYAEFIINKIIERGYSLD